MLYPVIIHKDAESDFGVSVPDLPGCISAGESAEEALTMIREAIELHVEGLLEDGEQVPDPTSIDQLQLDSFGKPGFLALVDVNIDDLMGPAERINITVARQALRRIDSAAERTGMSRSQFLVKAGLALSRGGAAAPPLGEKLENPANKP